MADRQEKHLCLSGGSSEPRRAGALKSHKQPMRPCVFEGGMRMWKLGVSFIMEMGRAQTDGYAKHSSFLQQHPGEASFPDWRMTKPKQGSVSRS
ncbi:hypothetical protein GOODEAATRI_025667 [Goodea atripinnis]|uniref:Uncharacterized protein n=1 Tax=Goodea atripinnis TaxID=208336 RepID=A0ABV0P7S8_9TELE